MLGSTHITKHHTNNNLKGWGVRLWAGVHQTVSHREHLITLTCHPRLTLVSPGRRASRYPFQAMLDTIPPTRAVLLTLSKVMALRDRQEQDIEPKIKTQSLARLLSWVDAIALTKD